MKALKYILSGIIGLVLLALITALILPKTFHAEGTIIIQKPVNEVFDYVKYVKNQEHYGVWFRMDEGIQKNYSGEDGTIGFRYEWKSKKVGDGIQVITNISDNQRVEMDLFFNGAEDPAKSFISTEAVDSNSTKVVWAINGEMPIPYNLMGLFYDMNDDFTQGVANLKEVLEK